VIGFPSKSGAWHFGQRGPSPSLSPGTRTRLSQDLQTIWIGFAIVASGSRDLPIVGARHCNSKSSATQARACCHHYNDGAPLEESGGLAPFRGMDACWKATPP
jgi:hypothetical protein